jgi:hypothetical protein
MTFEEKIRNFFKKHNPGYAYLSARIAKNFSGNQTAVLEHLHERFVNGAASTFDPSKAIAKQRSSVDLGKDDSHSSAVGLGNVDDAVASASDGTIDLGKSDDAAPTNGEGEATAEDFEVSDDADDENKEE